MLHVQWMYCSKVAVMKAILTQIELICGNPNPSSKNIDKNYEN